MITLTFKTTTRIKGIHLGIVYIDNAISYRLDGEAKEHIIQVEIENERRFIKLGSEDWEVVSMQKEDLPFN